MALLMHPLFNQFNISRGADIGIPIAHQTCHVAPSSSLQSPFTTPGKNKRAAEDDMEGIRSAKRIMAPERTINIFLRTIVGMGLPSTLCIPVSSRASIEDMAWLIQERIYYNIPPQNIRLATSAGRILCNLNGQPIHNRDTVETLLYTTSDTMLTLRLTVPLLGGKGGFGSQLRAAGGRMSSRKKKTGEQNGSSRNLDGRRLRTVTEAKALAEYLAIKPEMDKKEKEERRKRLQDIVDATERKTEEIKKGGNGKGRLDGKWVEAKEECMEKTREAVLAAMADGSIDRISTLRESDVSMSGSDEEGESESENEVPAQKAIAVSSSATAKPVPTASSTSKTFYGWDEDEDMSDSDEEQVPVEKGKAKAVAA